MKLHTVACVLLLVSIFLSCGLSENTPQAVLSVQPNPAFTGEAVTFICDKEGEDEGWNLYKDGNYTSSTDEKSFVSQAEQDGQNSYQCHSHRKTPDEDQRHSTIVTLIVSSAKPTPTLVSDRSVVGLLALDSVTLTCTVEDGTPPWGIYWYRDYQESEPVTVTDGSTYSPTVSESTVYLCRGGRGEPPYFTHLSNPVDIDVSERPPAVLTVLPNPTFTGETVRFTCDMNEGEKDWSYSIERDGSSYEKYSGQKPYVFNTTHESTRSSGVYQCTGRLTGNDQVVKESGKVTLVVSAKPKPTLTSDRDSVLTSNIVTLTCKVESPASWNIYWSRDEKKSKPVTEVTRQTTYTFRPSSVSESGRYWCRGGRGNPTYFTEYSKSVSIIVSEAPVPVLSAHPDRPETFIGETLTLNCTILYSSSDWTYTWLKDNNPVSSSENSEYILYIPSENPSGEYQCRGQRNHDLQYSKYSNTITVSFKDQPKATLTAEQTVIPAGGSVALSCSVEGSGWNYSWYLDSTGPITASEGGHYSDSTGPISDLEGGQYSTGPITVSEGGVYRCRGGRGDPVYNSEFSDALTLNTTDVSPRPAGLSSLHVGLIGGLVVVIVLSILLLLLWRNRTSKGPCCFRSVESQGTNQNAAADQRTNQSGSPAGDVHAPLQNDKSAAESSEVTYSQIELKNISKKMGAAEPDVTYAQVNFQNKANANNQKGGAAEPDVTYAQVNYQNKTKAKNQKEAPAPQQTEDAVYSLVKPHGGK